MKLYNYEVPKIFKTHIMYTPRDIVKYFLDFPQGPTYNSVKYGTLYIAISNLSKNNTKYGGKLRYVIKIITMITFAKTHALPY